MSDRTPNVDEILKVTEAALAHVRMTCGGHINLKSINLRVWAAASILSSAIAVSDRATVMEIFQAELEILAGDGKEKG